MTNQSTEQTELPATIANDPEAVWTALTSGERPYRIVDFPRKGKNGETVKCALWVMTHAEQMATLAAADETTRTAMKKAGVDLGKGETPTQGYRDLYTNAVCRETIFRVTRNAVDPTKQFFGMRQFVGDMTTDEVGVLYASYLQTSAFLSPITTDPGSKEEMEAMLLTMHRAGEFGGLSFFSLGALMALIVFLVGRVADLLQATSSSGTQHDSSSSAPSPAE